MYGDLLVGAVWIAAGIVLWPRRGALPAAVVGGTWLLGTLIPELALLHRGALAYVLLAYPSGRLASTPARVAVAAAYASAFADDTLAYAIGLPLAAGVRYAAATGVVRRSRLVPLVVAGAIGTVLAAGTAGGHVLIAYETVLVLAPALIVADLLTARWSSGSITGLVVDLGRQPRGGAVRERLARALGDPSLDIAYVLDAATVDELGRPVELPADGRAVTAVAGALLIHDPAVLADRRLLDAAAKVTSIAAANARLQADVRARVDDVLASTRRLLDAADAERRRLGANLRAHIDPLLADADAELRAGGATAELLGRLEVVRGQLHELASGLDPISLREGGLGPALQELARHAAIPASVSVPADRFPPALESCVWFTCAEAVANTLKHAGASRLEISVERADRLLRVEVADDGVGGADVAAGTGLLRLAERVRAAGGRLAIESAPGSGTRVTAEMELA